MERIDLSFTISISARIVLKYKVSVWGENNETCINTSRAGVSSYILDLFLISGGGPLRIKKSVFISFSLKNTKILFRRNNKIHVAKNEKKARYRAKSYINLDS